MNAGPSLAVALSVTFLALAPTFSAERLRAEQVVETNDEYVACLTEDSLRKFIGHAVAGEKTKAKAMLEKTCVQLAAGKKVKLLAVQGTMAEFVPLGNKSSNGFWAPIEAFVSVK